jgi:hypothetical protein
VATRVQVVIDCADPGALASFWADALGYKLNDPPGDFATWEDFLRAEGVPESDWNMASAIVDPEGNGPRFFFQRVPEPKSVKNRVHVDVNVSDGPQAPLEDRKTQVYAAVARLEAIGASRVGEVEEMGGFHVVMQDPEGNEFCVQ